MTGKLQEKLYDRLRIRSLEDDRGATKLERSDKMLEELALMECLKNIAVSEQDIGVYEALCNDEEKKSDTYCRLVDDATENGLNNYLEESLDLLETDPDLDTSWWKCSIGTDDPQILEKIRDHRKPINWLTFSQLGLKNPIEKMPSNKRARSSPPDAATSFPSSVSHNINPSSITTTRPTNVPVIHEDRKPTSHQPDIRDDRRPTSRLPDRLKNRVYPGRGTDNKLQALRDQEGAAARRGQEGPAAVASSNPFQSATSKYAADCVKQGKPIDAAVKRSLGGKSYASKGGYRAPVAGNKEEEEEEEWEDERMKGVDKKLAKLIMNEIMDKGLTMSWDDISGLAYAKKTIKEIVVWPMLRPDIFTGLRGPPKGVLLFGPPGTGKTLIGKCIASQSKSTFFSISASSLTSKWIGEGEKLVRALFAVARCNQPAVIFIDEIDSLLSQRSESEHESSRRIKTEFLIQLDGVACESEERLLIVGATNRPYEIDEAARRRLVKRLYIPLPDTDARMDILSKLLKQIDSSLTQADIARVAHVTEGYSGADMTSLCRDAALAPIRSIADIENINPNEVRPLTVDDLLASTKRVRSSVDEKELKAYNTWNEQFGSGI